MTKTFPFQGAVTQYSVPIPIPVGTGNGSYKLEKLEGFVTGGAGDIFLQIHDAASAAALSTGVSVPIRSVPLQNGNGFLWQYMQDNLTLPPLTNGLLLVLSNTNIVYTTYSGGGTMSLEVSLESWQLEPPTPVSVTGDLTTTLKHLTVWANGSVNTLLKIEAINAIAATTRWIFLFCTDAPSGNGDVPAYQWPISADPAVVTRLNLDFGPNAGFAPTQQQSNGVINTACSLYASTTPNILTLPVADDLCLRTTHNN